MAHLIRYLIKSFMPNNKEEAARVGQTVSKYTIMVGKLYKMGRATHVLRCLGKDEIDLVLLEVHEGICEIHIRGAGTRAKAIKGLILLANSTEGLLRIYEEM